MPSERAMEPWQTCLKGTCQRHEACQYEPCRNRTAAMDALIADSADMIAPVGEVERVTDAIEALAEGLWAKSRKSLGMRADFLPTSRVDFRERATAALSAMSPAGEVEQRGYDRAIAEVVAMLDAYIADDPCTEGALHAKWIKDAIEAGEHKP